MRASNLKIVIIFCLIFIKANVGNATDLDYWPEMSDDKTPPLRIKYDDKYKTYTTIYNGSSRNFIVDFVSLDFDKKISAVLNYCEVLKVKDTKRCRATIIQHIVKTASEGNLLDELTQKNIDILTEWKNFNDKKLDLCDKDFSSVKKGINGNFTKPLALNFDISKGNQEKIHRILAEKAMAENGFLSAYKLKSLQFKLLTYNDNLFHGAAQMAGVNKSNTRFEGDDRGKTFGANFEVVADLNKAQIKIKGYTDSYSKLSPQNVSVDLIKHKTPWGGTYYQIPDDFIRKYSGTGNKNVSPYEIVFDKDGTPVKAVTTSKYYYDLNHKVFLEFLNVQGAEFEVKHDLVNKDVYLKLVAGMETRDDTSGLAKKIQEEWHRGFDFVQYNYLDHMNKEMVLKGGVEIGGKVGHEINDTVKVDAHGAVGLHTSTKGVSETVVSTQVILGIDTNNLKRSKGEPALIRAEVEADLSKGLARSHDLELIGRVVGTVRITGNTFLLYEFGAEYTDDKYTREYGQAEKNSGGRFDIIYTYGIGTKTVF